MSEQTEADRLASLDAVPAALKAKDQWLVWRLEQRWGAAKPTKVPYMACSPGRMGSSTGPGTWCSFGLAAKQYARLPDLAGVGFAFAVDGGLIGIDLDESLDPGGGLLPWAQEIYDRCGLSGTYVEVSPSLNGLKAFVAGELPPDPVTGEAPTGRKRKFGTKAKPAPGGIEVYPDGRFFTVTGRRFPGCAADVGPCDAAAVAELHRRLKPAVEVAPPRASALGAPPADPGNKLERCWAYLRKCRPAVSGAGGHDATLQAACETVRFDLGPAEAAEILRRWNEHMSDEKWNERELAHKLESAEKHAGRERGRRLLEERRKAAFQARRVSRTLTLATGGAV